MTEGPQDVTLRPVSELDRARIVRWLREPGVQRWWGSAAAAEAQVRLALGSASAVCRIIAAEGEPVGYAQALDLGHGAGAAPGLPPGTWQADLFIASDRHRGKGLGAAALQLLACEVFATTLAPALWLRVSVRNESAVRACETSGFRWVGVEQDQLLGACWAMLRERP